MSTEHIDRSHDEEIIDIVRSMMDSGTRKAETANEHILIKLIQLRGTPMTSFEFNQEKVDFHYENWRDAKKTCKVHELYYEKTLKCRKCDRVIHHRANR